MPFSTDIPKVLDIPKIYTAFAEWLGVVAAVFIYRRNLRTGIKDIFFAVVKIALCLVLLLRIQHFCEEAEGLPWLLAMGVAVFTMIFTLMFTLHIRFSGASYIGARVFIWAEFVASFEWQIYHFYTFARNNYRDALFGGIFCAIFYVVFFSFFAFIESRQLSDTKESAVSPKIVVTEGIVAFLMFALSNLSYVVQTTPFSGSNTTEIFNIRTLVDIIGVVTLQTMHLQKIDAERKVENIAMKGILENQYLQYRESRDNIDLINRKYHDLKHQLRILREESDDDRRQAYLDEIEGGIEKYEAEYKTGNAVLDTVLTGKYGQCLKHHITMTVLADGTLLQGLSVMDLCTIFGNAVDNAIEYEKTIKDKEKRLIHLSISEKNGFACILVENYYEGKMIPDGSFPTTTKEDKEHHGYGLKSLKSTVERYGGYVNTSVRDSWFRLEMIIPVQV